MEHSRNVCRLYRELLILIKRLPKEKVEGTWNEARREIRLHKDERDKIKASDLMRGMVSKIAYLKSITPRQPGDATRLRLASGHWVLRDGQLVEGHGESKGRRVADGTISSEEAHQLHQKLLKRQYFGQEPPPNPAGIF